ncbi:hypothetical protein [Natranaerobius thermophilus]|uniref:hypothetical protein n=1 Tax=Natranaerobius thermophilus TaxID=375929 RepID=UPI0001668DC1|nr:hypothetical protein [Natranaerobius thermophilus]
MKKLKFSLVFVLALSALVIVAGCADTDEPATEESNGEDEQEQSLEGRYVGYSWEGEADGQSFDEAGRYIETILELDEDGIIEDATMRYFQEIDGYWTTRQSGNAYVDVDFSVEPKEATPGDDYQEGQSMFTVNTANMMNFYATAVDETGEVAVTMVDPVTRYQFDYNFPADFDYDTPMSEITVDSDYFVPTVRTSGGGVEQVEDWEDFADKTIFNMHDMWSHVVNDTGELEGIDEDSSVREFLEAFEIEFEITWLRKNQ